MSDKTLERFRDMHEQARRGRASLEYRTLAESFLRSITDMQNAAVVATQKRRTSPRVRRALQVELTTRAGSTRAMTFDVGMGGFSALLPRCPGRDGKIQFTLRLPRGVAVPGVARVTGSRPRSGAVRVSFAFQELQGHGALEAYLIDECLRELCPESQRAVTAEHFSVDLTGRALVGT